MWHVVFAEPGRPPQSRAARSRDAAIHVACELLAQSYDVRRVLEPNGTSIERAELDGHYDEGRFPGLTPRKRRNRLARETQQLPLQSVTSESAAGKYGAVYAADCSWHGAPRTNPTTQIVPSTLICACDL